MRSDLVYQKDERFAPIPPWEQGLQTVTAEYFQQVSKERMHIEGLCFDRNGDLYFVSVQGGAVYKLDMQTREITKIYQNHGVLTAAVKIHKDGRLFICNCDRDVNGGILSMNPDGSDCKRILWGYSVDDLVFDKDGGFYFTDMRGSANNPTGGVYYVSPDFENIKVVVPNLASPNGIALSMDQSILWITEHTGGRLLRVPLAAGQYPTVSYRFIGYGGVDSISIDEDDNLYIALFDQGRYMVFNSMGYPIANVLLPNRELGHNLCTSHAMIKPGTKELYMTGCDDFGYGNQDRESEGSWIFKAGSFGLGNRTAYQFT